MQRESRIKKCFFPQVDRNPQTFTNINTCGEEAFVAAGQPIPTLRYDPHGPPVSLAPPPIATRTDLLRLIQAAFRTELREGEDTERIEGAFEGLRRLASLQSQLDGLQLHKGVTFIRVEVYLHYWVTNNY